MKAKIKDFIKSPYGLIILISWIALIICLIVKLFGGNWFELWLNNDKFIAFCEFVDETIWLKMVLACGIAIITTYPALCVFLNVKKFSIINNFIFISLIIIKSISTWFISWFPFVLDLICLIIIPLILCKGKYWKRIIIGNLIVIIFQLLTLIIRNVNINFAFDNSFLIQVLYQIDYYLMIILFYLYNCYILNLKRKE